MERSYKYYDLIMAVFIAVLLISNIAATKILVLWKFTFDGGTILFPLSYIFGDVLTEVYGYKRSRRVIWTGFACAFLMSGVLIIVGALPPAADWGLQAEFEAILGLTWRIVLASLVAYAAGEFSNSYILAKMKIWTRGKHLWLRTIGSTLVGQGIDTVLFVLIAFAGVFPASLIWLMIVSNYVFKCLMEIVLTPATYKAVGFLKKKEKEDYYDNDTDFNPLSLK